MADWILLSGLLSFCQPVVLSAGQLVELTEWHPVKPHADDLSFEQMSACQSVTPLFCHPDSWAGVRLSLCQVVMRGHVILFLCHDAICSTVFVRLVSVFLR
jgi:hypothetical protein